MRGTLIVVLLGLYGCTSPVAEDAQPFKSWPTQTPTPPPNACTRLAESPASCWDWKVLQGHTEDGCYGIDPDGDGPGAPLDVYCYRMASYAPKEYVTLTAPNESTHACSCDVTVTWARVRLDLQTMSIVTEDRTFATIDDSCGCGLPGWAAGCGESEIDLTGTGLAIDRSYGSVVWSTDGLAGTFSGGDVCGIGGRIPVTIQ